jgi:thiol-disulfide isomerase/thioredoxin
MLSKSYYPDLKRKSIVDLMGKPAPDFTLDDLAGQKTTLSTLIAGKVALISFTACRCGACRLEAPVLTKLDKDYGKQGLVVLVVNAWDEPAELIRKYVESEKLTHRYLLNGQAICKDRYHFFETPTTCWIDHKGRVIKIDFGFDPGDEVALAKRAEELLAARKRDAR